MASGSSTKGNPASRRMSNEANRNRRARSWKNGQERKELRRIEKAEAEKRNKALRAAGLPTPWEAAKAKARERRVGRSAPSETPRQETDALAALMDRLSS